MVGIGDKLEAFYLLLSVTPINVEKLSRSIYEIETHEPIVNYGESSSVVHEIAVDCTKKAGQCIRTVYAESVRNLITSCRKKLVSKVAIDNESSAQHSQRHLNTLIELLGSWSNIIDQCTQFDFSRDMAKLIFAPLYSRIAEASFECFERLKKDKELNEWSYRLLDPDVECNLLTLDFLITQVSTMREILHQHYTFMFQCFSSLRIYSADGSIARSSNGIDNSTEGTMLLVSEMELMQWRELEAIYMTMEFGFVSRSVTEAYAELSLLEIEALAFIPQCIEDVFFVLNKVTERAIATGCEACIFSVGNKVIEAIKYSGDDADSFGALFRIVCNKGVFLKCSKNRCVSYIVMNHLLYGAPISGFPLSPIITGPSIISSSTRANSPLPVGSTGIATMTPIKGKRDTETAIDGSGNIVPSAGKSLGIATTPKLPPTNRSKLVSDNSLKLINNATATDTSAVNVDKPNQKVDNRTNSINFDDKNGELSPFQSPAMLSITDSISKSISQSSLSQYLYGTSPNNQSSSSKGDDKHVAGISSTLGGMNEWINGQLSQYITPEDSTFIANAAASASAAATSVAAVASTPTRNNADECGTPMSVQQQRYAMRQQEQLLLRKKQLEEESAKHGDKGGSCVVPTLDQMLLNALESDAGSSDTHKHRDDDPISSHYFSQGSSHGNVTLTGADWIIQLNSLATVVNSVNRLHNTLNNAVELVQIYQTVSRSLPTSSKNKSPDSGTINILLQELVSCEKLYLDVLVEEASKLAVVVYDCDVREGMLKFCSRNFNISGQEMEDRCNDRVLSRLLGSCFDHLKVNNNQTTDGKIERSTAGRISTSGKESIVNAAIQRSANYLISANKESHFSHPAFVIFLQEFGKLLCQQLFDNLIYTQSFSEWGALLLHDEVLWMGRYLEHLLDHSDPKDIASVKMQLKKLHLALKVLTLDAPGDVRRYKIPAALLNEASVRNILSRRIDFSKIAVEKVKLSLV